MHFVKLTSTAKGLGNGVPIGVCLATGVGADVLGPGQHGSTYGGNPLASAAGLAVVNTITSEKLAPHAAAMGDLFRTTLMAELDDPAAIVDGLATLQPVTGRFEAVTSDAAYLVSNDQAAYGELGARWLFETMGGSGNVAYMRGIDGVGAARRCRPGGRARLPPRRVSVGARSGPGDEIGPVKQETTGYQ